MAKKDSTDRSEVLPVGKPDNSSVKKDGGIEFTAWGIHVALDDVKAAKAHIKEHYGIDIDKDTPPAKVDN